jgi:DNA-binding transcriptional LysR family regulator
VNGPMTLDEASLSRGTVLEGVALGYVMERDVREDIEAGRLISVLKEWLPPSDELCIYYPGRRNPSAAHGAFVELARELGSKARNTA